MKSLDMNATILLAILLKPIEMNSNAGYVIGAIIALFILGYLLYTLFKPEKL
jgi:K+-transporting ATPase KdpF subunit